MKIRTRLFLLIIFVVSAGFYYLVDWINSDIRPRYMESVEENLVDTANLLASLVARNGEGDSVDVGGLSSVFDDLYSRRFEARIYDLVKTNVDVRVYVTDDNGLVLFDSDEGKDVGKDYSKWNDVFLTLKGAYGVRASRADPEDPTSLVLYIAAPIRRGEKTIGVLTVCKPIDSANQFIAAAQHKVAIVATGAGIMAVLLGLLTTFWVTRPIQQITDYASKVRDGQRPNLPRLGASEIGVMGRAMEEMRDALEGKDYVERYVQTLTHELKGPLSAVRGAVELLNEDMPQAKRERFLKNVQGETERIQRIVDRLLLLASVEKRRELRDVESIDLSGVIHEVIDEFSLSVAERDIKLDIEIPEGIQMRGERFLIQHAVANVLQNALEFSPPGGVISIRLEEKDDWIQLVVEDNGPGIPDYALARIYERFYSLQRPDTGKKSSGLGLSFVKEVVELHQGSITIENREEKGTRVELTFKKP